MRRIHLLERSGKLGLVPPTSPASWGLKRDGYRRNGRRLQPQPQRPRAPARGLHGRGGRGCGITERRRVQLAMAPHRHEHGASLYVNAVLGLGVKDPTAGFKCYRAETLRTIRLDLIHFVGYAFQIEMKYNAKRLGFLQKSSPSSTGWAPQDGLNIFKGLLGVLKCAASTSTRPPPTTHDPHFHRCHPRNEGRVESADLLIEETASQPSGRTSIDMPIPKWRTKRNGPPCTIAPGSTSCRA